MTSATLFREGPDLDELLAELDAEHGGRVRVTDGGDQKTISSDQHTVLAPCRLERAGGSYQRI